VLRLVHHATLHPLRSISNSFSSSRTVRPRIPYPSPFRTSRNFHCTMASVYPFDTSLVNPIPWRSTLHLRVVSRLAPSNSQKPRRTQRNLRISLSNPRYQTPYYSRSTTSQLLQLSPFTALGVTHLAVLQHADATIRLARFAVITVRTPWQSIYTGCRTRGGHRCWQSIEAKLSKLAGRSIRGSYHRIVEVILAISGMYIMIIYMMLCWIECRWKRAADVSRSEIEVDARRSSD
jgi:hypothetical protein